MISKRRRSKTFEERTGFPRKLLAPGYSGELSPEELEVLVVELIRSIKVRRRWGFEEGESITKKRIKELAMKEKVIDEQN